MEYVHSIVLGIVQGLAEFLPISSSGHLVILQHWLGRTDLGLTFNVAVHFGSLLAVVVVFWQEWWLMVRALFGLAGEDNAFGRRLLFLLVLASLPVAVVGYLARDSIETAFSSPFVPGIMLLVTGFILWFADRQMAAGELAHMSAKQALWMGIGQSLALLPGLSRSGTTLAVGMFAGLERREAARFSFLMAVPAVFGATLLETVNLLQDAEAALAVNIPLVGAGALASLVTSYAAIRFFLAFLRRGRLRWFAWYVWSVGLVALLVAARGG